MPDFKMHRVITQEIEYVENAGKIHCGRIDGKPVGDGLHRRNACANTDGCADRNADFDINATNGYCDAGTHGHVSSADANLDASAAYGHARANEDCHCFADKSDDSNATCGEYQSASSQCRRWRFVTDINGTEISKANV
jgi:hypothetical protein